MKKIIGFVVGTAAVLAVAIGVQANAGSGDEEKRPPAVSETTPTAPPVTAPSESPGAPEGTEPEDDASTPPAGASDEKTDDGDRDGFTEDHTGKPGENK